MTTRLAVLPVLLGFGGFSDALTAQERPPLRLTDDPSFDYHPAFSPDGGRVLFTSQRGGEPALWLVPADGGEATLVPVNGSGDLYSSWAPDGASIVIDLREDGGAPDLYRYWLGNGELQRLTSFNGLDAHPSVSPDGREIAFTSMRGGSMDIWIMNADGTGPRAVLQDGPGDWHPGWSPDGTRLVFESDRGGESQLWIVDRDGSNLSQVTRGPDPASRARWSPDGTLILFGQSGDLWVVSPEGGDPIRLTDMPGREGNGDWSPDGTAVVFSALEGNHSDLWVFWPDPKLLEAARGHQGFSLSFSGPP